jgi:hypothetical protein
MTPKQPSLVKQIQVRTITPQRGNLFIRQHHYSGKVVPNSQVHFGAFLDNQLHGVLQFGPSMDKRKTMALVRDTGWNEFIELNRLAFDDKLPRNSESRVIAICLRLLKKKAPHLKWVVSFADATQCGDGTIYRASGFVLTNIKKNTGLLLLPDGTVGVLMTYTKSNHILNNNGAAKPPAGSKPLPGYQLRYIFFFDRESRQKLTCPIIPFSDINRVGASMYKGMRGKRSSDAAGFQPAEDGAEPITTHQ